MSGQIRRGWLTAHQINQLIDNEERTDYKAIWALMADAGLRMGEVLALTREDILTGCESIRVLGKGNKVRFVNTTARIQQAVLWVAGQRISNQELIYLTARAIQKRFKARSMALGFPPTCTPHSLRHSYATLLVSGGMPLHDVQAMLGHCSLATTAIYLHSGGGRIQEASRIIGAGAYPHTHDLFGS
jgi:integrase/recombinase XerD